ncbi:GGDEF domain-containing protein [Roseateles cellulosilyticus]|uniref:diguanylate cyclase n=1 Tax=Pelomonas cellulosilytica TaxID=2906762 RepID=A0ABS8XPW9_9BURK|nr:GGDEF domain-containing protein [Pelomonas sp. P8]MCE4553702.1 GGDEF domain-containing protein [Pelomonas sp. P8]
MSLDSSAPLQDASRRSASLRLRLGLAMPVVVGAMVGWFEWRDGGFEPLLPGLTHAVELVAALSVALMLLVEALLLRPLRQLASGCEAMESAPAPQAADMPEPRLGAELDRIGHAMHRAQGSLWQHDHEARELRRQLAEQRDLLERAHAALEANQRELASLARIDALTGLTNQRAFDESLRREFKRAQRQRGLLALAVLDLDEFKQFNERHGTAVGDATLQRVAALLNERFKRDTDIVARLGGEEFVALLPGCGMAEAQGVLELVREDLRALHLPDGRGDLTLSIGLAALSPAHPYLSAQALMQAADEALYIAKHAGRDRLSLAA